MEDRDGGGLGFVAGRWPLDAEKRTLVFIHGAGGSSVLWRAQVESLKDRANTVALDLPGHARSEGPGRSAIADYAGAVADFIKAMELPKPIPGPVTRQLYSAFSKLVGVDIFQRPISYVHAQAKATG